MEHIKFRNKDFIVKGVHNTEASILIIWAAIVFLKVIFHD